MKILQVNIHSRKSGKLEVVVMGKLADGRFFVASDKDIAVADVGSTVQRLAEGAETVLLPDTAEALPAAKKPK